MRNERQLHFIPALKAGLVHYRVYTSFKGLFIFKKTREKLITDGFIAPAGLPVCRKKKIKVVGLQRSPLKMTEKGSTYGAFYVFIIEFSTNRMLLTEQFII